MSLVPVAKGTRRDAAMAGTGAVMLGSAPLLTPIEDRYNRRVAQHYDNRISSLRGHYGLDERGRPTADPRDKLPQSPESRFIRKPVYQSKEHRKATKKEAAAVVRRKYAAINQATRSKKVRSIPLAGRSGRAWGLTAASAPLLWAGSRGQVKKDIKQRDVDRAFAGAVAGGALHHAAHYGAHPFYRSSERKIDRNPVQRSQAKRHRKDAGLPDRGKVKLGDPRWLNYYRTYPTNLPGGKAKRVFSRTHGGKTGGAVFLASALAGGGYNAARGRQVNKALYQRDTQTSPRRAAQAGVGLGLAAWGVPRLRMMGPALRKGVRIANDHQNPYALEAMQRAAALTGVLERGTGLGERHLRQIRALDETVRKVPKAIRPEVATAAGALLVSNARPIRRDRYRPVVVNRPVVRGW